MREFLTSGLVGNIDYNAQKQIREQVQQRWDSLGLPKVFLKAQSRKKHFSILSTQ